MGDLTSLRSGWGWGKGKVWGAEGGEGEETEIVT